MLTIGLWYHLFVPLVNMAAHRREFKIVSWNCNGISSKAHELGAGVLIDNHSPDIFCLSETKLEPSIADNILIKNHTLYRCDRTTGPGHGGGVMIGNRSNRCPFVSRTLFMLQTFFVYKTSFFLV